MTFKWNQKKFKMLLRDHIYQKLPFLADVTSKTSHFPISLDNDLKGYG